MKSLISVLTAALFASISIFFASWAHPQVFDELGGSAAVFE
jgi:hypothetical protein